MFDRRPEERETRIRRRRQPNSSIYEGRNRFLLIWIQTASIIKLL